MMRFLVVAFLLMQSFSLVASDLEVDLRLYISQLKLKPVNKPEGLNQNVYKLGKKLFFETEVSGNKNISCASCHSVSKGTSDGMPLSIGERNNIIPRNSPALFNLGHNEVFSLFWDGRVFYNKRQDIYITPSEVLNGKNPKRADITSKFKSVLAAQALFPLLSHDEMRGEKGTNEIADAENEEKAWALIMKRLLVKEQYRKLFKVAFPNEDNYNIGHLANAIAHFQKFEFASYTTPWDQYLRGDSLSLTDKEKRGAIIFLTKGMCITCHTGNLFGGRVMANIGSPQIGPGKDHLHNDEGRFHITKKDGHRYFFKTPALRNVALSAPYFHSGAYESLEQVIDHYTKGLRSLDEYDWNWAHRSGKMFYGKKLFVETNRYRIFRKKENAHPIMKRKMIILNSSEKSDLLLFLSKSLTDLKFK